jgi:hypothetical protein
MVRNVYLPRTSKGVVATYFESLCQHSREWTKEGHESRSLTAGLAAQSKSREIYNKMQY